MLQQRPGSAGAERTSLSATTRALCWTAFVLDVILVASMLRMGGSLDESPLFSMITLGGHHRIVLGLATAGLLLLGALAPWTHGFEDIGGAQQVLLPIAGLLSLAALAGLLSVVALAAGVVSVLVLLVRPRAHVDVLTRRR